jgi:hypothetical protein
MLSATFLGGSAGEYISALELDNAVNIYVAGQTHSPDFPGVGPGSADSAFAPEDLVSEESASKLTDSAVSGGSNGSRAAPLENEGARTDVMGSRIAKGRKRY